MGKVNLLEIRFPPVSGSTTIDGAVQNPIELRQYNPFGQITRREHPTAPSDSRVDTYAYYNGTEGAEFLGMTGYLKSHTAAAGSLDLVTRFEYDAVGNVRLISDPAGARTDLLHNQAGLLIRELSRPTQTGGIIRNRRDLFYDAATNLVRTEVENRNETGMLDANASYTTAFQFDSIGRLTSATQEIDASSSVIEEMTYDGNDRVVLLRKGAALAGQSDNTVSRTYDERGLLYLETRGGASSSASTARFDYDLNGNLAKATQGLGSPEARTAIFAYDGHDRLINTTDAMGNIARLEYNRVGDLARTTIEGQLLDQPAGMGPANVLLAESKKAYDELDRLVETSHRIFNPTTGPGSSDTWAKTTYRYRPDSMLINELDADGTIIDREYDAAQRLTRVRSDATDFAYLYDTRSNIVRIDRTDIPSDSGVSPNESFRTELAYDPLDRLIQASGVRQFGAALNSTQFAYNSRNLLAQTTDPKGNVIRFFQDGLGRPIQTDHLPNGSGSQSVTTSQQWDHSSRLIARTDGSGRTTRYAYDPLDRNIVTRFADGTLQQVGTGATWTDPAQPPNLAGFNTGYDSLGNAHTRTDARQSTILTYFDDLGRTTQHAIVPGPGVGGDMSEYFYYDGRSLVVRLIDPDSDVTRTFDSLGRLVLESHAITGDPGLSSTPAIVTYEYEIDNDLKRIFYPGGFTLNRIHDSSDRLSALSSSQTTPDLPNGIDWGYKYIGHRVASRSMRYTESTFIFNGQYNRFIPASDDGIGQVSSIVTAKLTALPGGGTSRQVFDAWGYKWDKAQNRKQRIDTRLGSDGPATTHTYDNLHRLKKTTRNLNPSIYSITDYALDATHNLVNVIEEAEGIEGMGVQAGLDAPSGSYALSPAAPELDAAVHQYTSSPLENLTWDAGGNLTTIRPRAPPRPADDPLAAMLGGLPESARRALVEELDRSELGQDDPRAALREMLGGGGSGLAGRDADLKWDWRNRLVEYVDHSGGATGQTHRYRYDALGRRTLKQVDATGPSPDTRTIRFVYGGAGDWQILEEQRPVGASAWTTISRFTYGGPAAGIDEVLHVWRAAGEPGGGAAGHDYLLHTDDQATVTSATDTVGNVIERYRYGDYGAATVLNADGTIRGDGSATNSAFANTRLFTGREFDPETGLYCYRNRYLDSSLARFISRDPLGVWGDPANLGSPFAYVAMRPGTMTDPMGFEAFYQGWGTAARHLFFGVSPSEDPYGPAPRQPTGNPYEDAVDDAIDDQARRSADFDYFRDNAAAVGETAARMASEPADMISTLGEIAEDPTNKWNYAGLIPGIPGTTKKAVRCAENVADAAKDLRIINKALAGKQHPVTGVPFDKDGFADFSGVSKQSVEIKQTGDWRKDYAAANKAAGYDATPKGYTWHHHQNTTTMQLVPTQTHLDTGHTGGAAVIRNQQRNQ